MKTLMLVLPGLIVVPCSRNLAVAAPSNMGPSSPCLPVRCPLLAWLLGRGSAHPPHVDGWSISGHWHHLGLAVGITALVGCGNPTPDAPVSGHTSGSADAVASLSAGGAPRAGLTAHEPARQAPTQTSSLGPPAQHASTPGARITDASRATRPAHDAQVQTADSPADPPPPDEHADADQAQREARQQWFTEMRESPNATVRLQALELLAQHPIDALDPETFAFLDDEDAQVRARAEQLWEQQLSREAGAAAP